MDASNARSFNLRHYYSVISFGFIVVIAIALGVISHHFAVAELLSLSEQKNVAMATTFRNSLWPDVAEMVRRSHSMPAGDLKTAIDIPLLRQRAVSLMNGTNVAKIKIYNLDGLTIFSTKDEQIGEMRRNNPGFATAAAGRVISELTHRDSVDAFEGVIENRDLASSYLPVLDDRQRIVAVFELSSDVTPFVLQMQKALVMVVASVVGLLALLYAALHFVVARAHRIIQTQRSKLEKSNEQLDARVRDRTAALLEANRVLSEKIIERRRAEEETKRLLIEKDAILNTISEGVAFLKQGTVLTCNRRMEELFGFAPGEFLGKRSDRLYTDRNAYRALARDAYAALRKGLSFHRETQLVRKDGSIFWGALTGHALTSERFKGGSVWVFADISERKKAEERMRLATKVFENTQEGVIITNCDTQVLAVNKAFTEVTGYLEEEVLGKTPRILHSGRQDKAFYDEMWSALDQSGQWKGEIWNRRKSGEIYPEWLSISTVRNDRGDVSHYVGVFSDITEIKRSQDKVSFLAYHDPLTQLPNRLLFNDRLAQNIQRATREKTIFAVYFIDLDNFKNVNDSLGHHVGDRLLREVAQQLQSQLRKADTIGRLGGDEFIVLVNELDGPRGAALVAEKLAAVFQQPFSLEGHELYVTASIGICLYPTDGGDTNTLIRNADAAMYRAKGYGKNQFHFYEQEMTAYALERLELESALRKAIINDEFLLCYQAQIDLQTHQVVGAEALVRWNHPQLGVLEPGKFIPLAEDSGLITHLGEWVLRAACRQMRDWRSAGFDLPKIAVNLSVRQLERKGFARLVASILHEHELPASALELEITESVLMQTEEAFEVIEELDKLGIQLSVDDFGTGYSSLSYLKRLPVRKLKIDRSFITDVTEDGNNEAIVRAMIAMAKTLGLNAVAEGVETKAQVDFLRNAGCDHAQGYLFGRPVTSDAFASVWGETTV
ncbi:sensor domain-containing protein [Noviherbaspirillum sp.]|uniref:sensor domain-containing protein n=1 Tax=Noviherbaspirillum sp. TaxID=1926288 RepID=UPI002B45ACC7|nr:EAL domain-containing protein [Noviherbaspirillum sp.]HJV79416.1 EAL domain-containing protein [Noviherbaspirillum sp.]